MYFVDKVHVTNMKKIDFSPSRLDFVI